MPWLKKPSPLKGNPTKKDTSRYWTFHEGHVYYTNDCFAWKRHLEDLVKDGHCTEFIAMRAIQQIKDCDTANNEPTKKVIWINTIITDSKCLGLPPRGKRERSSRRLSSLNRH
ncbi:unnamed protein product [Prunus armeniaca]